MTQAGETRTLNLVLLGHGKMGRVVEQLAPVRGCRVQLVLSSASNRDGAGINAKAFRGAEVCIEFTTPAAAVANIGRVAALGCSLVVGTTGWHEHLDEVRDVVASGGIGLVYGANFSIGANLFYRIARSAAAALGPFPGFEPYILESHHRFKKDAPSGTALELKRQIEPLLANRSLPVASIRVGYIPGTHELGFDSEAETLILRHTTRTRQAFAEGALYAARWIVGKKGLFHFSETLDSKEVP